MFLLSTDSFPQCNMGVTHFWENTGKPLHERSERYQVFKERGSGSTPTGTRR